MWIRYLIISFFKFVTNFVVSLLFLMYILPQSLHGYAISAPMWLLSFIIAFGFAELAFKTKLPGRRETIQLLVVWMVVTITLQIFVAFYLLGTILPVINSLDIYIQYLLEIIAVLMSAYLTRRRKIKATFGEGLSE